MKTIIENNPWLISSFLENKAYNFNKKNILAQLPEKFIRRGNLPLCIGQKQKWYLLRLINNDNVISLDQGSQPEFDRWKWVSFWQPVSKVIYFKRQVYCSALEELAKYIFPNNPPKKPKWWSRKWQEKFDLDL